MKAEVQLTLSDVRKHVLRTSSERKDDRIQTHDLQHKQELNKMKKQEFKKQGEFKRH